MIVKLVGIFLVIVGGVIALQVLFPLIGSVFGLAFLLVKLAVAVGCVMVGLRLANKER
jgi:hypothetical protein